MKIDWPMPAAKHLLAILFALSCYTSFSAVHLPSPPAQYFIEPLTKSHFIRIDMPLLTIRTLSAPPPLVIRSTPEKNTSPGYQSLILKAARKHELDPALIRAVIMVESSCNPKAVSRRGAKGLMQLMPGTAAELGVEDSFDPAQNINGGTRYLRKLMDRFDNDVQLALAAYNAGSRYVRKYKGVPPFPATRAYVDKVMAYQTEYRQKRQEDDQSS